MGEKPTKAMRILLVDDDQDVRDTIKLVLKMERHNVIEANDGREALDYLKKDGFDLVITDYVMPEMSGDVLAAEMKRNSPSTPLIMITANADLLPNQLPGVDRVLSKPFEVSELVQMIREFSERSSVKE